MWIVMKGRKNEVEFWKKNVPFMGSQVEGKRDKHSGQLQ